MRARLTLRFAMAVVLYACAELAVLRLFPEADALRATVELCLAVAYIAYVIRLARHGPPTM